MPKAKVSATVSPDRLARAREVTGTNSVSDLIEEALGALIERELERRWLDAHPTRNFPARSSLTCQPCPGSRTSPAAR